MELNPWKLKRQWFIYFSPPSIEIVFQVVSNRWLGFFSFLFSPQQERIFKWLHLKSFSGPFKMFGSLVFDFMCLTLIEFLVRLSIKLFAPLFGVFFGYIQNGMTSRFKLHFYKRERGERDDSIHGREIYTESGPCVDTIWKRHFYYSLWNH